MYVIILPYKEVQQQVAEKHINLVITSNGKCSVLFLCSLFVLLKYFYSFLESSVQNIDHSFAIIVSLGLTYKQL